MTSVFCLDVPAAWTRRDIKAVELKGRTAATFYPEPDLRVCGDIDWWFPDTQGWNLAHYLDGKYDRGEYIALLEARGLLKWNAVVDETLPAIPRMTMSPSCQSNYRT